MQDKKMTMEDLSLIAGLSTRTISRVLNNSPLVSQKTKEQVHSLMKELNYAPDKQARGLASSRSYLLGLIYDNFDSMSLMKVQSGVLDVCAPLGYELVVHPCKSNEADFIDECLNSIIQSKLDGVIVLPPISENKALAQALRKANCSYIRIACLDFEDADNIVLSDEREAMKELADHFVELGHTNIGFISGPLMYRSSQERMGGFISELEQFDIHVPSTYLLEGTNSYASGLACAKKLLSNKKRPTAIIASNDEMAAGVIRAAYDLGIQVPAQLSVAGFGDNFLASIIIPPLTTIHRPIDKMAKLATQKLINKVHKKQSAPLSLDTDVGSHLIKRQSTDKINSK